jgi:hypothetical protein
VAVETKRWQWLQAIASKLGPADSTTRHVLMTLSLHMNQLGEQAFPSQRLLAERSGLSERSVRTHLQLATKAGWLLVYAKQPNGKGWRLHEYVAAVPEQIVASLPQSPYDEEPNFQRAEPVAARARGFSPISHEGAEVAAAPQDGKGHRSVENADRRSLKGEGAANGAQRAANGAEGAATDDTSCGKSRPIVRNQLPTNLRSNSGSKSSGNSSYEGGLTPTARLESKSVLREEEPEQRLERLRKVIAGMPKADDESIRVCVQGASLEEVRQARRAAS